MSARGDDTMGGGEPAATDARPDHVDRAPEAVSESSREALQRDRSRRKSALTSASTRLALALFALLLLPIAYPGTARMRPLAAGYLAISVASLWFIHKGLGGRVRGLVFGAIDLLVASAFVHRTGSASSMLIGTYLMACVLNVLTFGPGQGLLMALVVSGTHGAVVLAEQLGYLPYGPDAPAFVAHETPPPFVAFTSWGLVAAFNVLATVVIGRLVSRIRRHERELIAANLRLEEISQRDALTDLYNRRHIMSVLERELARVRRGARLAVVMIDLDRFKRINDTRGHLEGDHALRTIAESIARSTRGADVLGRYGGDEFLVVMPDTDREQAQVASARLVASVRRAGELIDQARPVTASVGIAVAREGDDVRPLVRRADEASYRAKQEGGDRACVETDER